MEEITVGDSFMFLTGDEPNFTIVCIDQPTGTCVIADSEFNIAPDTIQWISHMLRLGYVKKIDVKLDGCKHNFILYESFTDIFEYCTVCNEKRK